MDNDDLLLIIKTLYQYILKCFHFEWKENNKNIHHFDEISGKILDKITNIKINNHNDNHNRNQNLNHNHDNPKHNRQLLHHCCCHRYYHNSSSYCCHDYINNHGNNDHYHKHNHNHNHTRT